VLSPISTTKGEGLLNICQVFSIAAFAFVNYFCASNFYAETRDKQNFTPVAFSTFVLIIICLSAYGVFGAASIGSEAFFKGSDEADIFPYYYIDTRYTSGLIKKVTGVVFMTLSVAPITKVPIFTIPMVVALKKM